MMNDLPQITDATRMVFPAHIMQPIYQEMADRTAQDGRERALTDEYEDVSDLDGTITARFKTTLGEWLSIKVHVTDLEWRTIQ